MPISALAILITTALLAPPSAEPQNTAPGSRPSPTRPSRPSDQAPQRQESSAADLRKSLRRVDQVYADTGPLSTSLRQIPPDLSVPFDFRDVYKIPADAPTPYAGWYARRSGGVTAVFPRSQYDFTRDGLEVVVPADTRFILGDLPLTLEGRGGRVRAAANKIDLRADTGPINLSAGAARVGPVRSDDRSAPDGRRATKPPVEPLVGPVPPPETEDAGDSIARMFLDDAHRQRRLARLLSLRERGVKTGPERPAIAPVPPADPR